MTKEYTPVSISELASTDKPNVEIQGVVLSASPLPINGRGYLGVIRGTEVDPLAFFRGTDDLGNSREMALTLLLASAQGGLTITLRGVVDRTNYPYEHTWDSQNFERGNQPTLCVEEIVLNNLRYSTER